MGTVVTRLVILSVLLTAVPVSAQEPMCRPEALEVDPHQYLRALSLDLRGVVPTVEEHERVAAAGEVPEALVDEWLASEELADRIVRRHGELLWPNVENVRLIYFRRRLRTTGERWWRTRSEGYRGAIRVPCLDEPARFGPGGEILTTSGVDSEGTPIEQEGWVLVRPYWDPSSEIEVCAFDAQEHERSPITGRDCRSRGAVSDAGCGCGPSLVWCDTGQTHATLVASFHEDVRRRIRAVVLGGEPYTALFTSRRAFVNGPLAFFWRHQTPLYDSVPLEPVALEQDRIPDMAFTETDRWVDVELPEHHAGLLTSPVYLLRFQTNRARANRFYDAFLCEPFQPPPSGLPFDDPVAELQPDVQLRSGCKYCHALLEPAAAHWGRWTQQGGGYLDETGFPTFRTECQDCARGFEACSDLCRLHYVTRAIAPEEEPYLGMLRAFQFLRPEHEIHVREGPTRLVREATADNRLPSCTTRRTTEWLYGREPTEVETAAQEQLSNAFLRSDFDYRALIESIVTGATYRRVR